MRGHDAQVLRIAAPPGDEHDAAGRAVQHPVHVLIAQRLQRDAVRDLAVAGDVPGGLHEPELAGDADRQAAAIDAGSLGAMLVLEWRADPAASGRDHIVCRRHTTFEGEASTASDPGRSGSP